MRIINKVKPIIEVIIIESLEVCSEPINKNTIGINEKATRIPTTNPIKRFKTRTFQYWVKVGMQSLNLALLPKLKIVFTASKGIKEIKEPRNVDVINGRSGIPEMSKLIIRLVNETRKNIRHKFR